ncbi:MAG: hypothetical protein R3D67_12330 [Hyphomicrobiaceae bacterium]
MATKTGKPRGRFAWGRLASWIVGVPLALLAATSLMLAILRGNPTLFVAVAERVMPRTPARTWEHDEAGNAEFFKYGALGNEASRQLAIEDLACTAEGVQQSNATRFRRSGQL